MESQHTIIYPNQIFTFMDNGVAAMLLYVIVVLSILFYWLYKSGRLDRPSKLNNKIFDEFERQLTEIKHPHKFKIRDRVYCSFHHLSVKSSTSGMIVELSRQSDGMPSYSVLLDAPDNDLVHRLECDITEIKSKRRG